MAIGPNWISETLLNHRSVVDSFRRLSGVGKIGPSEVRQIALDPEMAIDLRIDALVLFAASAQSDRDGLRMLLESSDKLVIVEVLKRIREFGTEWAAAEIIARAKSSNDPSERAILAWTLAGFPGNRDALAALLEVIRQDSDLSVRNHAIESLGNFRVPEVVDALLSVLDHGSPDERFWSLFSLGTIRDARAVEAISRCLQDETRIPDFGTISAEAQWALQQISGPAQDTD
jgi:HEAT repeat protein